MFERFSENWFSVIVLAVILNNIDSNVYNDKS